MQENRIKKAVRENRVAIGTTLGELATRGIPKLLEYAGLDWVMIEMEHSSFTVADVADLIGWFKATPITVIVRPPENLPHLIGAVMDAGAMGVILGGVESASDARSAVQSAMYPPLGKRRLGLNAAHTDFSRPNAAEYMRFRNAQTTVIADIESAKGVENIDEIAAVDGIDVIQPGRYDLSVDLGVPEQFRHESYWQAVLKVARACARHGKVLKYNPNSDRDVAELYELGCRVMGIRAPTVALQDAMKGDADRLREQLVKLRRPT